MGNNWHVLFIILQVMAGLLALELLALGAAWVRKVWRTGSRVLVVADVRAIAQEEVARAVDPSAWRPEFFPHRGGA